MLGNQKLLLSDNVSHEMFSRDMQCITLLYINSLSLPKRMLCLYSMPTRSEMVRKQCYRAILKRFHFHVVLLSCVSFCVYLRKSHYRLSWQYAREIFPLCVFFSRQCSQLTIGFLFYNNDWINVLCKIDVNWEKYH